MSNCFLFKKNQFFPMTIIVGRAVMKNTGIIDHFELHLSLITKYSSF